MNKKHLLILFLVSVVVRFLVSWLVKHFEPTLWEYEVLTQNMLNKGEYVFNYREYGEYQAVLAPGFSVLTYGVYYFLGTSHVVMLFLQYLLMFASAVALYKISLEFFNNAKLALITGLLVALHPGYIHYSSNMLHELCLYIPLFYWCVYFLIRSYKTGKGSDFIYSGIFASLAIYTRATFLPIFLISLLVILFLRRTSFVLSLKNSILALVVMLILYSPWVIRNYLIFDKFIFAQTNKWESFWVGNNLNSTGGHYNGKGEALLDHKPLEMQKEIDASNSELLDNEIFKKYAMQYVKENPGHFIKSLFYKGIYFWWFHPQTGLFYPPKVVFVAKIVYALFLFFTIWGLVICWRQKLFKLEMLFPLFLLLGIWAAHTVYFMEMRHRWTLEPVMMLVAVLPLLSFMQNKVAEVKRDHVCSKNIK